MNSFRIDGPLLPLSSEILARTSTSVCICTTQNSVSIERDRKIFARLATKKKMPDIVSKNKRKTNGNFTSDS